MQSDAGGRKKKKNDIAYWHCKHCRPKDLIVSILEIACLGNHNSISGSPVSFSLPLGQRIQAAA